MKTHKYSISGMSCAACQANITKAVSKLSGVETVNVNLITEQMVISFDETKLNDKAVIEAVTLLGYGASLMKSENENENVSDILKKEWKQKKDKNIAKQRETQTRLFASLIILVPLVYLNMASSRSLPMPQILHGNEQAVIQALIQMALAIPILILNRCFFISGFKALKSKSPNMDTLIALGSSASFVYGVFSTVMIVLSSVKGNTAAVQNYLQHLSFESGAMVLTLITVGKYLESRSKSKTGEALEKLIDLSPQTACIIKNGSEIPVNASDVMTGDTIIIRPGERIPVDGVITGGYCTVDQSPVTGESVPVEKTEGDEVISATINKNGTAYIRATRVGSDTTFSRIIKLVDEAGSSKAPVARLADKVSGIFVPFVTGVAAITFIVWILTGAGFDFALSRAVTVLVISCPCALGLATPVAIMAGTGKAAENGILVKSASVLESLHSIDTVVLDKTGTVTEGLPQVSNIVVLDKNMDESDFLRIAASIENGSEHPLSHAVMTKADEESLKLFSVSNFTNDSGLGINAEINGVKYFAGSKRYMAENNIDISKQTNTVTNLQNEGKTLLFFSRNETLIGIIAVTDNPKISSINSVRELKKIGKKTIMLTGDNESAAAAVAGRTGIDEFRANVLPGEKELYIRDLQKSGEKVAMVGDGINDAPALVCADIGIAIGSGTDIAIDSADIVLLKSDLSDVVTAIKLGNAVMRNIKINLFWAFFYNILCIPLAAGALYSVFPINLTPVMGSAAMSLSSLCVVTNALRLRYK